MKYKTSFLCLILYIITVTIFSVANADSGNNTQINVSSVNKIISNKRVPVTNVSISSNNIDGENAGNGSNAGAAPLSVNSPFKCNTLASSGNAADDGRRAYNRLNCVSCHGQDGSGGMGPNIKGAGGDVAEAVYGEGAMPSFAGFLCPNDIIDLEAYLGNTTKIVKYLDWDDYNEKIQDGYIAPKPVGVIAGP